VAKKSSPHRKLSFAEKAREAEKKALKTKKENSGLTESLIDKDSGAAASVSKIIQNMQKTKKLRNK